MGFQGVEEGKAMENFEFKPLYVGTMNDALFIIDKPPRPWTDDVNPNQDVEVIAKLASNGRDGDAYARLFAASPRLLKACIECLKVVDDCYETTGHIRVAKTSHQRLQIEAAIAEALGQEQPR